MTRRSTFRGSPGQEQGRARYWLGVAGNLLCCLTFSALFLGCLKLVADHLAS